MKHPIAGRIAMENQFGQQRKIIFMSNITKTLKPMPMKWEPSSMTIENQLRISESFYSIQGEGATSGYPAYFIRLQGCNLMCGGRDGKLVGEGKA